MNWGSCNCLNNIYFVYTLVVYKGFNYAKTQFQYTSIAFIDLGSTNIYKYTVDLVQFIANNWFSGKVN